MKASHVLRTEGSGTARRSRRVLERAARRVPSLADAWPIAVFVAAALLVGPAIARADTGSGSFAVPLATMVGGAIFLVSIPFLLGRWRATLGVFLVWLVLEDLIRKFSGNDLRVYLAKDAVYLILLLGLALDPDVREWWSRATGTARFFLYALIGWAVVMAVPAAWSDWQLPILGLRFYFMYAPLVIAGFGIGLRRSSARWWLLLISAVAACVSVLGIIQATVGPTFLSPGRETAGLNLQLFREIGDTIVFRPTATFVDAGRFGWFAVLGFAASLAAFVMSRGRQRTLALVCAALTGSGIWISGGRAGLVIGVGLVIFAATAGPFAEGRLAPSRIFKIAGGVALAAMLLAALLPSLVGDRFTWYSETLDPRSGYNEWATRIHGYVENTFGGLDIGGWVGRGTGTESLGKQYLSGDPNTVRGLYQVEGGYAAVAVEMGAIGLALWLAWSIAWVGRQWRSIRAARGRHAAASGFVLFGWMLSFLFVGFVLGLQLFQNFVTNAYFWLLSGVIFAIPYTVAPRATTADDTTSIDVAA